MGVQGVKSPEALKNLQFIVLKRGQKLPLQKHFSLNYIEIGMKIFLYMMQIMPDCSLINKGPLIIYGKDGPEERYAGYGKF